ncbi:uncharacterized protein [Penaeus vannamei]|uniref:uncharacterized protein n=1 Tax=Penaeus vannamei TaxID=6689 RepID=UPI00387F5CEC
MCLRRSREAIRWAEGGGHLEASFVRTSIEGPGPCERRQEYRRRETGPCERLPASRRCIIWASALSGAAARNGTRVLFTLDEHTRLQRRPPLVPREQRRSFGFMAH